MISSVSAMGTVGATAATCARCWGIDCSKVCEQLDILRNLEKTRTGSVVHQQIMEQLHKLTKLWSSGHLVWGPMLAFAYVKGHPITMSVPEDPLQEAALDSCAARD